MTDHIYVSFIFAVVLTRMTHGAPTVLDTPNKSPPCNSDSCTPCGCTHHPSLLLHGTWDIPGQWKQYNAKFFSYPLGIEKCWYLEYGTLGPAWENNYHVAFSHCILAQQQSELHSQPWVNLRSLSTSHLLLHKNITHACTTVKHY